MRNLAHEIKNPLGGIRGAAQLLERELPEPELREFTQVIVKETDRLQALMNRMLTPHRLPQIEMLNVHEVMERVRMLLLAEYPDGLSVRRDYDVSLPDLPGDRESLIQAILNVARNAAQALSGAGQIGFRTRIVRQATIARTRYRHAVAIEIEDNGPGIPHDLAGKVFFPLVSGREGGTGLGLSLAQSYVHQHHGLIEFESAPGRTCFTILLPVRTPEQAQARATLTMEGDAMNPVWIIDDDRSIRWVFEKALAREGIAHCTFATAKEALERLAEEPPQVVVTDIRMPGISGLDFMQALKDRLPSTPVIVMTAYSDLESAVAAFQGGAFEYLPKPFDVDHAVELVRRAIQESRRRVEAPPADGDTPEILGQAPAMQEVFRAIGRLSHSHATVLITGESGTGKELVARALHRHSPRSGKAFVAINTAAIPKDLLESELFGHERGAFTGAQAMRRGRFEQAEGGTLFLDEIGDMPPDLPDAAAARALRQPLLPRRGPHADHGERARDRGHPPGPRGTREAGPVPRGPLPPAERDPSAPAQPARASRRHPGARAPFPCQKRARTGCRAETADRGRREVPLRARISRKRAPARESVPLAYRHGSRVRLSTWRTCRRKSAARRLRQRPRRAATGASPSSTRSPNAWREARPASRKRSRGSSRQS